MSAAAQSALADARKTARMLEEQLAVLAGAQSQLSEKLNQAGRRLRSCQNAKQWSSALVEATQGFCGRAALFALSGRCLRLQAVRGIQMSDCLAEIPLASAPAFTTAVESEDTVVAICTKGELSQAIAALVGEAPGRRCSLFPIAARERVAAILYADAIEGSVDRNALEVLAAIAALVLETRLGNYKPANWADLERDEQQLHLRARRFARVAVARIKLYHSQAVKNGRAGRDLYTSLKQEIDSGRETFRNDFLSSSPAMVDYFHLEIVRMLANEEGELLGPDYPGPMV